MRRRGQINNTRWGRVRRRVLQRDGYRCRECGRAGRLEAHHRVPLWREPDQDVYALDGLITLCRGCHIELHRGDHRPEATAWDRFVDALR